MVKVTGHELGIPHMTNVVSAHPSSCNYNVPYYAVSPQKIQGFFFSKQMGWSSRWVVTVSSADVKILQVLVRWAGRTLYWTVFMLTCQCADDAVALAAGTDSRRKEHGQLEPVSAKRHRFSLVWCVVADYRGTCIGAPQLKCTADQTLLWQGRQLGTIMSTRSQMIHNTVTSNCHLVLVVCVGWQRTLFESYPLVPTFTCTATDRTPRQAQVQ